MEEYIYPKDHSPDFLSILVPNVDNVRTDYLIQVVSNQGKVCTFLICFCLSVFPFVLYCFVLVFDMFFLLHMLTFTLKISSRQYILLNFLARSW